MDLLTAWLETRGTLWEGVRVLKVNGREAISELFTFDVDVICERRRELPESAAPEGAVTLVIARGGAPVRKFHGKVFALRDHLDAVGDNQRYRLRIVPHHQTLAMTRKQQVYLGLDVLEVIGAAIGQHQFAAPMGIRRFETYAKREMTIQYGETDLAFVSRLAEHQGIAFFFEHDGPEELMVFADAPSGFHSIPGAAEIRFEARSELDDVFALELTTEAISLYHSAYDASDRAPAAKIEAENALDALGDGGLLEHDAHLRDAEEAAAIAKLRSEESLCRRRVYEGQSRRPELFAGGRFVLRDHPRLAPREELLVTEVLHQATFPLFGASSSTERPSYRNDFRAIPGKVVYRPARKTPRARIPGLVSAVIQTGPNGQRGGVAVLDNEGRYTVRFHFDPAKTDGLTKTSAPIRMAQPFAGDGWGMHFPLRPGTEVIVAFVNGDPDRPVIVGAVPNRTSPSVVVDAEAHTHRIRSPGKTVIEFGPAVPKK